jgi:hypothetical protein
MSEPIHLPSLTPYSGHSGTAEPNRQRSRRRSAAPNTSSPSEPSDTIPQEPAGSPAEEPDRPGHVVDVQV